jgi:hypothetical protein
MKQALLSSWRRARALSVAPVESGLGLPKSASDVDVEVRDFAEAERERASVRRITVTRAVTTKAISAAGAVKGYWWVQAAGSATPSN